MSLSDRVKAKVMISAELLRKYSAQPQTFTIHLADGRALQIPHGRLSAVELPIFRFSSAKD
jgi:hypothetical protein